MAPRFTPPSRPRPSGAGADILVVEDEHLVALDIKTRLERMGHVPVLAYSGEAAIARAAQHHFDLALMDIKLRGDLDGIETAARIHDAQGTPVIYLTAYADEQTLSRARKTEPYGYVLKPFQEQELRAAIDMALHRAELDKERSEQQRVHRFLADASAQLAASLDDHAIARGAADLLVPRYADWCMVRLEQTRGAAPTFAYTYPEGTEPAGELISFPLVARGQTLGALLLVPPRQSPRFTSSEMTFLEDFGHRLGMALDNALLFRVASQAIRMRDDVLAIVSHDLRSPLSSILLRGETVAAHPELGKQGAAIVRAAHRMQRLINDLVDASAINAGQLALEFKPHLAAEVVRDAIDSHRLQAEAKPLVLRDEIASASAVIACDRDRIVQALSNLLGNAVKFTPAGGEIVVRVTLERGAVRIAVEDTGPGIPPDQLPHLFDRFWRGEAGREGSGLGLFIARGIVAAHGGTLEVTSTVGRGACFYFRLPDVS